MFLCKVNICTHLHMNYIADEFLKKLYILSKVKESVCYVKKYQKYPSFEVEIHEFHERNSVSF